MRTISEPLTASLRPEGVGSKPETVLLVLMWLRSAATPGKSVRVCNWSGEDNWPGHTRAAFDIVEGEVGDTGVELHQQRQGLANAAAGTKDGDLGGL